MKDVHGYNHIKIVNMYVLRISLMEKDFQDKLGGIQEVYHGTSQANLLSIINSRLRCSPPATAEIAGKCFGGGIYGAIHSSKSLGYTIGRTSGSSTNRWGQSVGDSGWLCVCDFAMGKYYEPTSRISSPPNGYDSVWVKHEKYPTFYHDELIVYNDNQARVKYLLECNR